MSSLTSSEARVRRCSSERLRSATRVRLADEIGNEAAHAVLGVVVTDRLREIIELAAELVGIAGSRVEMLHHLLDDVVEPAAAVAQQVELPGLIEEVAIEVGVELGREGSAGSP